MDDKLIRDDVLDELDFEPSIDATNIGVAVDDGVVTLTGHVSSYAEKLLLSVRPAGSEGCALSLKRSRFVTRAKRPQRTKKSRNACSRS